MMVGSSSLLLGIFVELEECSSIRRSAMQWSGFGLLPPKENGWTRSSENEWVCDVWQSAYGHLARKRTWLLYVGGRPPFELQWEREPGVAQIGWFDRNKPTLGKRIASRTPFRFAMELLSLAVNSRLSVTE
jgi:hypothetical protein